jgi:nitroimidazol reductase NimA-like FMN-containing flavoprotein (pyridoxamine 5'-phosphate oxidase superfamily)
MASGGMSSRFNPHWNSNRIWRYRAMTATENASTYAQTDRSTPSRYSTRVTYEHDAVHAVLDEALVCHVSYVVDGRPMMIPTLHVRVGSNVYIHGSVGGRLMMLATKGPVPICICVTLTDGLVMAKSWFNHSVNSRSVIIHGDAAVVSDPEEKWNAMVALMNHVAQGRAEGSRGANKRELAATSILRIPLEEVSLKYRFGPPKDDEEDLDLPHWSGLIPISTVFGEPQPLGDQELPDYLKNYDRETNGWRG